MKKLSIPLVCILAFALTAFAQNKIKTTAKQPVPELKRMLTGTGLPYKMITDSLAVIPYEGENIPSYQVLVQRISDLYIVFTNLTETLPGKIDDTKYKYLLERNNDFDIIKIGLDNADNTVYVRADVFRTGASTTLLTRIIKQVANVTNIIAGDLK